MKITYKTTRQVRRWIQVENEGGYFRLVTETVHTGLTWDEAKAAVKADRSLTPVREHGAAPVTVTA